MREFVRLLISFLSVILSGIPGQWLHAIKEGISVVNDLKKHVADSAHTLSTASQAALQPVVLLIVPETIYASWTKALSRVAARGKKKTAEGADTTADLPEGLARTDVDLLIQYIREQQPSVRSAIYRSIARAVACNANPDQEEAGHVIDLAIQTLYTTQIDA